MKSKSFKLKVLALGVITIIGISIAVNGAIKNNNIKNDVIAASIKADLAANKIKEIKQQQLNQNEQKIQLQINQKQKSLEATWKIGYDQFFKKEYNNAIETERKVIQEDPTFYKAYAVEGIALAYSGNFEKGMAQIDLSLKLNPSYGYARFNKALTYELYHHYDEALTWYNKALEVEKSEWSYYGIASIYGRKGDTLNTIKYLNLAIEINPSVKNTAKTEEDFNNVRESPEFKKLLN
ncbi:MAG: tetratricopeptide repeat protein [Clostridium sp.]|uniref:tetratricopeptide repeat protein n=1 Tax=Clostridium sp. TaxID=1506 RepID=UPI003D6CE537